MIVISPNAHTRKQCSFTTHVKYQAKSAFLFERENGKVLQVISLFFPLSWDTPEAFYAITGLGHTATFQYSLKKEIRKKPANGNESFNTASIGFRSFQYKFKFACFASFSHIVQLKGVNQRILTYLCIPLQRQRQLLTIYRFDYINKSMTGFCNIHAVVK